MNYKNIKRKDIFRKVKELSKGSEYIYISVLGWDDSDYFIDLCKEDGGINSYELELFEKLPISKKINISNLPNVIKQYSECPILSSSNGNYIFNYDLHIWNKSYYIVYNFRLEKAYIKKMNFLENIFKKGIQPIWQNEK